MSVGSPLAALQGVPATVVGGYLGSGKTTLINGWLRDPASRRWAVLVNDLGSINVDAERLRQVSGQVLELSQGCLCCSLRDGLGPALQQLARLPEPPAHILVETSGMAVPERVASQLQLHGLELARLLLVVDLERIEALWHDPWLGQLVQQQFDGVDLLQFTKADRIDPARAADLRHWLAEQLAARRPGSALPMHEERQLVHSESWLQLEPLPRRQLLAWARQLPPEVLRLKGEVWLQEQPEGPVPLDRAGEQLDLAEEPLWPWPAPLQRRGRLVAISRADAPRLRWPLPTTAPLPA